MSATGATSAVSTGPQAQGSSDAANSAAGNDPGTIQRRQFDRLPIELKLKVWGNLEHQRVLIALWQYDHRADSLAVSGFVPGNWRVSLRMPANLMRSPVGWDTSELAMAELTGVDVVGDLVGIRGRREDLVHFAQDMFFLAIRNPDRIPNRGSLAPVRALRNGALGWAERIRNLAVLVRDEQWSFWGGGFSDQELRDLIEPLPALRQLFLVLALPDLPPGFDNASRAWGFMPLGSQLFPTVWPWFDGEYHAVYRPLIDRVRQVARNCGRSDVEIQLVLDINMDRSAWDGPNREPGEPAGRGVYNRYPNTW
ncbi:hypothetical protein OQA88_11065 [Cercophora sp. LCS_1]